MTFAAAYALAWSPVLLVMGLALLLRRPALDLALAGTAYTFLLCGTLFRTPFPVLLAAGMDGILKTLPLLLVIVAGIALSTVLLAAGSLQRIVQWYSGRVAGEWHRTALLSIGIGNFMEGAGVIAEPVVAPMVRASGLSPVASAALSIVGYSGLMTLALGGIIVSVLATVTGIPLATLGVRVALLSALPTVLLSVAVPWFVGGLDAARRRLALFAGVGAAAAAVCVAAVLLVGLPVSVMLAGLAVIGVLIAGGGKPLAIDTGILRDFAPLALIIAGLGLVSLVPPLRSVAGDNFALVMSVVPDRPNALRPLSDAYTYIAAAVVLAMRLQPFEPGRRAALARESLAKAWRPVAAMALFGAMGQMIAYSGYGPGFQAPDKARNLAWVLAQGTYQYAGSFYPLFAPLLGWVGTFLTGYGVASIMLFGKFQVDAAGLLGCSPAVLAAGMAVGASVGSVSSPFKIALATPLCGAAGREADILRKTVPLGIGVSLALGILLLLLSR